MKLQKLAAKLAYRGFYKLAQQLDEAFIQGPSVQVDPALGAQVQDAVNELKKADPNIFKGIGKITVLTGGPFGMVTSKDPSTVQINLNKIKQEVQKQMGGTYNPSNPEHKKAFDEAVKRSIVETVSHEAAHTKDFNPETGKFPGGEGVAESAERSMMQKMYQGKPIEMQASLMQKQAATVVVYRGVSGNLADQAREHKPISESLSGINFWDEEAENATQYAKRENGVLIKATLSVLVKGGLKIFPQGWGIALEDEDTVWQFLEENGVVSDPEDPKDETKYHKFLTRMNAQTVLPSNKEHSSPQFFMQKSPVDFVGYIGSKGPISNYEIIKDFKVKEAFNRVAVLVQKVNKNTGKKEWALVSKKDHDKVLEWYGAEHPSKERVEKTEKRVQWYKHKSAQTGIEPSGSQLAGHDNYNITGNDYMAGGSSAEPKETRLQMLYRKHKTKLKKRDK